MDRLTFVSNLISTVIWPLLILFIAWKFRSEFSVLLTNITKFEGPGFKLERELDKAERIADAQNLPTVKPALVEPANKNDPKSAEFNVITDLVIQHPASAVIAMWKVVENALMPQFGMGGAVLRLPRKLGLPAPLQALYEQLREVRNMAVHSSSNQITADEAEQFIVLSRRFLAGLRELSREDSEEARDYGSTEELVKFIKDNAEAIEKVVIPQTQVITMSKNGRPTRELHRVGAVITMLTGSESVIGRKDAEALLNDGILQKLRIPIAFARDQGDTDESMIEKKLS